MIFIRADANEHIGSGHVMRCLSIASAFANAGEKVLFICAEDKSASIVERNGFQVVCLNREWMHLDLEIETIKKLVIRDRPKLLIVDSYYVTEEYFRELSGITKLVYIDDLNKACWQVQAIINYNIFSIQYDYSWYGNRVKLLLGPEFAPLREEFQNCPPHVINQEVRNVFVSSGGAEPERIIPRLLQVLTSKHSELQFHFVVGGLNPNLDEIRRACQDKDNVHLHINEAKMAHLMQICDIAISASGSTLYELCACGVPTISYALADNQLIAAEQFEHQGLMLNAGDSRNDPQFIPRLDELMKYLASDVTLRNSMAGKIQTMVDGHGAERIARELMNL